MEVLRTTLLPLDGFSLSPLVGFASVAIIPCDGFLFSFQLL
jgi:hypothetical protein